MAETNLDRFITALRDILDKYEIDQSIYYDILTEIMQAAAHYGKAEMEEMSNKIIKQYKGDK